MLRILLLLALASLAAPAYAEVIVIDVQTASGTNEPLPWSAEGWTFTDTSTDRTAIAALDGGGSVLTLITDVFTEVGGASIRATRDDGAPFDLHGFTDVSARNADGAFEVVGSNGARFALPESGPVFAPSAFSGLSWFEVRNAQSQALSPSLRFDGIALEVSEVPEPWALAWMVPAAALLVGRHRTRRCGHPVCRNLGKHEEPCGAPRPAGAGASRSG